MVFSSLVFLFIFFIAVLAIYYIIPNRKYRNIVLCIVSLLFYGWGEPVYLLLMIFSIFMNYGAGLLVDRFRDAPKKKKGVLIAAVTANLLMLGVFKYTGFVIDTVKAIFPVLKDFATPVIPLPIGISFYTFQAMSYVIDVYRNDAKAQKNPLYFGTYLALFPQLIAGPIVRYRDIDDQLTNRHENVEMFAAGIKLFAVGLSKKVLIANPMGSLWAVLKASPDTNGVFGSWIGLAVFSLQLYFDFSGYSDMAIGMGKMFGFEFLKNFDYPFTSKSMTEFWRRWHISLTTWFREYVYFPLGGNRKGLPRQLLNLAIVWLLTGLWHGASWNFALWGLFCGSVVVLEKLYLNKLLKKAPAFLSHFYTVIIFVFSLVLFDFTDMNQLGTYAGSLIGIGTTGFISHEAFVYILSYMPVIIAGAVASTPLMKNLHDKYSDRPFSRWLDIVLVILALVMCTSSLVAGGYNPFIYFRF